MNSALYCASHLSRTGLRYMSCIDQFHYIPGCLGRGPQGKRALEVSCQIDTDSAGRKGHWKATTLPNFDCRRSRPPLRRCSGQRENARGFSGSCRAARLSGRLTVTEERRATTCRCRSTVRRTWILIFTI